MASGSAQGSSTGTRRWTLDGRSDEDRLADHSRGCAPYDFEASGPPIAIGEKVEVVELSAPSERDVEKAEWMDVPESPLTNDEVKALAAAVIAYELEPNEVYMTRDDSLALWGEVSRRLQDERSAVLSAVPSRPGGDAEDPKLREAVNLTIGWLDSLVEVLPAHVPVVGGANPLAEEAARYRDLLRDRIEALREDRAVVILRSASVAGPGVEHDGGGR